MIDSFFSTIPKLDRYPKLSLGNQILDIHDFKENPEEGVVIFSVGHEVKDAKMVRDFLYCLFPQNIWPKTYDFGFFQVKQFNSMKNLQETIEELYACNMVVLVINHTDFEEVNHTIYQSCEQLKQDISLTQISPKIELEENSFLHKICTHEPNYLFNVRLLGFQNYLNPRTNISTAESMNFQLMRLGILKEDIQQAEPFIRESQIVFMDCNAIETASFQQNSMHLPNGINGYEMCQLAWFSGMNDMIRCYALMNARGNSNSPQDHRLLAQNIWHFIEGMSNRKSDHPNWHENFMVYTCQVEPEVVLSFYKSKRTDRWWYNIPNLSAGKPIFFPCSYTDYHDASHGNLPKSYFGHLERYDS